jgi:hypothetical protein
MAKTTKNPVVLESWTARLGNSNLRRFEISSSPSSSVWQSEGFASNNNIEIKSPSRDSNPGLKVSAPPLRDERGITKPSSLKQIRNYGAKYGYILDTGDASVLTSLSPCNRQHAMAALAYLSKKTGRYNQWQAIRERYNLKWSSGNNTIQSLQRFFNPELNLESMLSKVKEMIIDVLPKNMGEVVKLALLTGLRPTESIEAAKLIRNDDSFTRYYDSKLMILQHYKFSETFVRATKKAWISYITLDNLQPIRVLEGKRGGSIPSWNAIRLTCNRKGVGMNMRYCRKIHGSWLHSHGGVSSEEVDFLHGRAGPSIFSRHYLTPDSTLQSRVLEAVRKLQERVVV